MVATVGFIVFFIFGACTGSIVDAPKARGRLTTETGTRVRFFDYTDYDQTLTEHIAVPTQCVCKEVAR